MRKLEVISRHPGGAARPHPLIFVHGAFAAGWIWDVHFLPYFAKAGYECHAVSLRGHGRSEGADELAFASLQDYVEDLEQVINGLDRQPILIGHSMGGMVVQRYLQTHDIPAAVLMASVPPYGLFPATMAMVLRDPLLLHQLATLQAFGPVAVVAPLSVQRALFSSALEEQRVREYLLRMGSESQVIGMELMRPDLMWGKRNQVTPIRVIGARGDAFVPDSEVLATARFYETEATIHEGLAHAMMLEPKWQMVADDLIEWLNAIPAHPEEALAA